MSYDLTRLRSNGLIQRRPHTNTYQLTADGQRVAIFYTKVYNRLLRPLLAADRPPAPLELRAALTTIDRHLREYTQRARLRNAPENSRLVSVSSDQRIAPIRSAAARAGSSALRRGSARAVAHRALRR